VELGYWEGYLQRTQYLAGPSFTLADVYAGVCLPCENGCATAERVCVL
jgi:glutathione S-transferase